MTGSDGQIKSWFDLNHDWITRGDLILEKKIWFESVLFWFITTWFDLQLRDLICDLSKSHTESIWIAVSSLIKEYQPTTNRYLVRIKLNYVDCTNWHANRNCLYCSYYLDVLCICVTGLKLFYFSGTFTFKFKFKIKMWVVIWFDLGKWILI